MTAATVTPEPTAEDGDTAQAGVAVPEPVSVSDAVRIIEPYKGLSYFEEIDKHSFAGRGQDIVEIVARVTTTRSLVLYGRSGLGKTSLVLAGVLPRLKPLRYFPVYVRTLENPLIDLIRAIQSSFSIPTDAPMTLPEVLTEASKHGAVLLVLDQFEEFFIRFKNEPKLRSAFVQALSAVILDAEYDVHVLFSLREDHLAALDDFQRKLPDLFQNAYRLLPLTALAAREVIVRPLKDHGVDYDERIVARLVDELAVFGFDTARLQITCVELFRTGLLAKSETLSVEDSADRWKGITGIEGVFRRYVQSAIDALAPDQHLLARTLLDVLITRQETKFAISASELEKLQLATDQALGGIIKVLVDKKIIRPERRSEQWYELIHECLVPEIREWLDKDEAFSNFRLARDLIANNCREGRFRNTRELLLSADALKNMVAPHKERLRGLNELQSEYVLVSAIYRHADDVSYWAELFGREKSAKLIGKLLDDADVSVRAGAAAAAVWFEGLPEFTERCLQLALDPKQDAQVQRAAGETLAQLAGDKELEKIKTRLTFFRVEPHVRELLADLEAKDRVRKAFGRLHWRRARRRFERRILGSRTEEIRDARGIGALFGLIAGLAWAATSGGVVAGLIDWIANPLPKLSFLQKLPNYFGVALPLCLLLGAWIGSRLVVASCKIEFVKRATASSKAIRRSKLIFWLLYPVVSLCLAAVAGSFLAGSPIFALIVLASFCLGWPLALLVRRLLGVVVEYGQRATDRVRFSVPLVGWTALANLAICVSVPIVLLLSLDWGTRLFFALSEQEDAAGIILFSVGSFAVWFGFLAFVSLFTLSALRQRRSLTPIIKPTARRRWRVYFALLAAVLPVWFLALYGRDSIPLFGKRFIFVEGKPLVANLRCWPETDYFQINPDPGGKDQPRILRVQHDGSAGLVFHKRPVDSGLTDFVLFMPSGKTDLAISNTIQPSLRTAEVTFSTVELHEKSKIPFSNDVVYILCTLDPSAKKAVAATDKRYWVYDLNYELEEPYNRQDGDSVQLQLYRNSIIEPDHKITGYALTTARTRPSLGSARSGQDIRGKELSPVQAQGTTPGGLLPNGDSDEMETVELRSGQIGFFPRASSDESSSAGADTVILPKRRISVDEKGRFQAQLRLEETPEEKQVVAKPLDQSSQPAKLHLVIGVQLIRGAEIAFNQGNDAFRRDKRDSAVASYKKAVELEPDNVEYLLRLGFASERTGDLKTAIASYRKAVELNPNDADTLYTLGLATEKSGDLKAAQEYYRKAVTSYKRALELNPDDAAGLYNFGLALGKTGDLKAATASYKKALELKPDDADTLINLGWALQKTGDFEAAIAPYKKALELKPNDADALYTLGLATEKSGDLKAAKEYYQKAVTSYKRAIELNPDDAAGLYSLGLAIEKTGDFEAAQEYYRKAVGSYREAVELKPDDADALNNLGLAIEKTGDFEAAQEYYRKAVAVRPEDAQIQNNLAWDLVKLKCFADALEPAQKAVELTPKDPSPWDTYAHAAFGIEWWDAAAKGWDKVIELQGKLSDKLSEPECADDEDKWKKAHENSGIPLPAPVPEKSKK